MAEASFNNFFNKPFGLNIKVPDRTLKQAGKTLSDNATGVLSPLTSYLEENEEVFNGNIAEETSKMFAKCFNIGATLKAEDEKVNGEARKFDSKF